MDTKKKVLAISGSTRQQSTNYRLIRAIERLAADRLEIQLFDGLAALPHFNPDLAIENTPQQVADFRRQIAEADGLLICTPEYAHGVPGSLKNAIDWTVTTADLDGKPVMLVTASTDGREGHRSLLETLRVIQARTKDLDLLVPFAGTKVNNGYEITDAGLLQELTRILHTYYEVL